MVDRNKYLESVAINSMLCQQVGHDFELWTGLENIPIGSCFAKSGEKWV